ncbi:hypothetical protein H4R18_000782 [Coemansia javaensis]|uniref:Uncharacterized protein n=1 Tax=Coemansia javaensis TaxID=2761396 RepID=A0A9W8LMH8_9FUNG|nr:hypothetical protein H4R18_000782 [Coemansia javaensis]
MADREDDALRDRLAGLLAAELKGGSALAEELGAGADGFRRLAEVLLWAPDTKDVPGAQANCAQPAEGAWDVQALRELAEAGRVAGPPLEHERQEAAAPAVRAAEPEMRVTSYSWARGVRHQRGVDAGSLDGVVWLDVADPTEAELEVLAQRFGLHPLTVEDVLAGESIQDKAECLRDYLLLSYRTVAEAEVGFFVVLTPACALSLHSARAPAHAAGVARRIGARRVAPAEVAYMLVDDVTDWLGAAMGDVEAEVLRVDQLVMAPGVDEQRDVLQHIGLVRRRLLSLWRLVLAKPDAVRQLSRAVAAGEDLAHHLADVCDHLAALCSACAHCELVLSRAHANYLARLSLRTSRMVVSVCVFSNRWVVLLALMLPLQLVAMAFGQNIRVPWKFDRDSGAHNTLAPWLAIAGIVSGLFAASLVAVRYVHMSRGGLPQRWPRRAPGPKVV